MAKSDGGAAFPRPYARTSGGVYRDQNRDITEQDGMSLRDYFAAHAPVGDKAMWGQGDSSVRIEAARAWRWADAMLAERNK